MDEVGVLVIAEAAVEDVNEELFRGGVLDGRHEFDPFFEVARHPVGGGDEDLVIATLVEVEDAHVFELLVDDGDDFDVLGFLAFAGFEAADATDVELDFDARFGGGVEGIDHVDVFERVHLGDDAGFFTFEGAGRFFFDETDEGALDLVGCGNQSTKVLQLAAAGDGVEEDGGVGPVFGTAGEEGDVGVEAGGELVVVSGAEVDVAF